MTRRRKHLSIADTSARPQRSLATLLGVVANLWSFVGPFAVPTIQSVGAVGYLVLVPAVVVFPELTTPASPPPQPRIVSVLRAPEFDTEGLFWNPPAAVNADQEFFSATDQGAELRARVRQLEDSERRLAQRADGLRSSLREAEAEARSAWESARAWRNRSDQVAAERDAALEERNAAYEQLGELQRARQASANYTVLARIILGGGTTDVRQRPTGQVIVGRDVVVYLSPERPLADPEWDIRGCRHERTGGQYGQFARFTPTQVGTCRVRLHGRRVSNGPVTEMGDFGVIVVRPLPQRGRTNRS